MNGYILLYKKIWDNELIAGHPYALTVWIWLLTHCDADGVVKCGRNQIAKETGVKAETVRYWTTRFLRENYQLTTIKTTNKYSVYHICNFKEMQQSYTSKPTRNLPENYQQTTTNKQITNKPITNKDTNVSSSTSVDVRTFFYELVGLLGYTDAVKYTDGRKRKLQARIRASSHEEIRRAARAIADDPYMQGDNPAGRRYGDIDYLIRSDEQIDKWIQKAKQQVTYQADW